MSAKYDWRLDKGLLNAYEYQRVFCFIQEKAAKWKTSDGQMDGLTTNGVLVMHPRNGFSQDSKPGVWREISVCGNVFTLRETRSAQQRGKMVGTHELFTFFHRCIYLKFHTSLNLTDPEVRFF